MNWFPIFIRLKDSSVLVVGGGPVALRKTRQLLAAGARVTVVAPQIAGGFDALVASGEIEYVRGAFAPALVEDRRMVIAATDSAEVNSSVAQAASARGILVNVVDTPHLCDFISPAIVARDGITIAIGSDGRAPILAREVKSLIDAMVPHEIGRLAELIGRWRTAVRNLLPESAARRRFWESIIRGPVARSAIIGDEENAARLMARALENAAGENWRGEVYIVGAGPGDPELLTLRALKLMQSCDVVLHDRLVSPEILALVRRDAEKINVSNECGGDGSKQERINALMIELAKQGKRVLRLKGGDPFIFGRGGEEAEALSHAGVAYEIVPGITAAAGCAASARIPLTHRDSAHACVLVSGHLKDGAEIDWERLAAPGYTLVFYMSLGAVRDICERLIAHGLAADTPAAMVSSGTRRDQNVLTGSLGTLPSLVESRRLASPAILMVGEVVGMRELLRDHGAAEHAAIESAAAGSDGFAWMTWIGGPPVF